MDIDKEVSPFGVVTVVDTSAERFGAKVTIAHLARYSFGQKGGTDLTAYGAIAILRHDWRDELESIIAEDRKAVNALFRDGAELRVKTPGRYAKPVESHWRAPPRA